MEQPSIKAIDKVSVARICSGQVITDLATAVKELVENSLDAGAKHVEVKLKEFGLDLIEVSDNGSGVSPSNYEGIALKYHTSKLSTFSDLTAVTSFGFRGEALSSLCELAGSFSVTTRTSEESVGVRLTYSRNGKLVGKETAPRQVGTTVSIGNMFEPLPVRRGEFKRNIKKQYNRLLRGMQAYALISLGVRITVTNAKAKGGKQTLIGTQYNNKIDDNVTNVFGAKFLSSLVPFNLDLDADDDGSDEANVNERKGDDANATPSAPPVAMVDNNDPTKKSTVTEDTKPGERRIWGMVSKAGVGVGRADNDRQFLYLNGRPVDLPKFTRAISEVWRAYEMKQKPAFVLDIRLPPGSFDVNVTPDKREIFMTDEGDVIDHLKTALHELWAPSRYTIPVNQGQLVQARLTDGGAFALQDSPPSPPLQSQASKSSPPPSLADGTRVGIVSPTGPVDLSTASTAVNVGGVEIGAGSAGASAGAVTAETDPLSADEDQGSPGAAGKRGRSLPSSLLRGAADGTDTGSTEAAATSDEEGRPLKRLSSGRPQTARREVIEEDESDGEEGGASGDGRGTAVSAASDVPQERRTKPQKKGGGGSIMGEEIDEAAAAVAVKGKTTARPSEMPTGDASSDRRGPRVRPDSAPGVSSMAVDLQGILTGCRRASRLKRKRDERNASAYSFSGKLSGRASADDQDSKAAARAFSRVLQKEHFCKMRVVGQFNLGFMICLLGSDLFILDQHACDEKYNFEVLQKSTTIHQQPLVRPLPLETSASEEMTIIDNMAIFEKNGFKFTVDEQQPTTKKLKITALPFSKGTQFGVNDVHELASIVADSSTSGGETVRLPKAWAMLASRACRSSVMIGKALDRGQMSRLVAKMATIEQPWNCPHGRPTMRHLADVSKNLRAAVGLEALLEA